MTQDSTKIEAVTMVLHGNDADPEVTREDWLAGVNKYFDEKEQKESDLSDWTDDADSFSSEGTDHVEVEVRSFDQEDHIIYVTDFKLTPEQARSMFLGIRDDYAGWVPPKV